jgi:ABC-type amino acid transport system permease subunit
MDYDFSFDVVWGSIGVLFSGLLTTLQITGISMVLGLTLGIFIAIFRLSRNFAVSKLAAATLNSFAVPRVGSIGVGVLLPPIALGMGDNYVSSVIALTLYVGAIYGEAFGRVFKA